MRDIGVGRNNWFERKSAMQVAYALYGKKWGEISCLVPRSFVFAWEGIPGKKQLAVHMRDHVHTLSMHMYTCMYGSGPDPNFCVANVSTPSKANNCMFPRNKNSCDTKVWIPDPCMCTCAQITYAHGPARICTASCLYALPSKNKTPRH